MFDMRGVVPFLLACGAILGALGLGLAMLLWRGALWILEHVRWEW
jgi:hypothetical protein